MKKILVLAGLLLVTSCGTEIVIVEPTPAPTATPTPLKIRPKPKREECSVAREIHALSRQATSREEIFNQCLALALKNEPSCHEMCNP